MEDGKKIDVGIRRERRTRIGVAHACFISCLFLSFSATAQHSNPEGNTSNLILLLQPDNPRVTGYEETKDALEAHLEPNFIKVQLHPIKDFSKIPSEQMSDARKWAKEQKASAVIWINIPSQTMFVIFEDNDGNEQLLSRYFSCISQSFGECGDAIASAVSSALSVWIEHDPPPEDTALEVQDNELNPIALDGANWRTPSVIASFFTDGGYVFNFGNSDSFTHGLHLGAGTIWRKHLSVELSGELLAPIRGAAGDDGSRVEVLRRPMRILLGERLPIKRVSLGISVGLMLSFDIHRQYSADTALRREVVTVPGFTADLSFRYRFLEHIGVWTILGMDTYSRNQSFESTGSAPGINISSFQWRLALGLELSFDVVGSY